MLFKNQTTGEEMKVSNLCMKNRKTTMKRSVHRVCNEVTKVVKDNSMALEDVHMWQGVRLPNCFAYGLQSEACMEKQLAEMSGRERQTTFMSDMSVAEWVGGLQGLLDTIRDILHAWINNEVYIAEFLLCVNWKS